MQDVDRPLGSLLLRAVGAAGPLRLVAHADLEVEGVGAVGAPPDLLLRSLFPMCACARTGLRPAEVSPARRVAPCLSRGGDIHGRGNCDSRTRDLGHGAFAGGCGARPGAGGAQK